MRPRRPTGRPAELAGQAALAVGLACRKSSTLLPASSAVKSSGSKVPLCRGKGRRESTPACCRTHSMSQPERCRRQQPLLQPHSLEGEAAPREDLVVAALAGALQGPRVQSKAPAARLEQAAQQGMPARCSAARQVIRRRRHAPCRWGAGPPRCRRPQQDPCGCAPAAGVDAGRHALDRRRWRATMQRKQQGGRASRRWACVCSKARQTSATCHVQPLDVVQGQLPLERLAVGAQSGGERALRGLGAARGGLQVCRQNLWAMASCIAGVRM